MQAGCLAEAPLWTDLASFDGRPWRGVVDTLTAGYPCQPFSRAGRRRGEDDPRHLWPHVCRIIGEVEPGVVFLENVLGHLTLGFPQVREDLEELGYRLTAGLFTAAEIGTSQKRQRLFILARTLCPGLPHAEQRALATHEEERAVQGPTTAELPRPLFPPGPGNPYWAGRFEDDDPFAPGQSALCRLADGLAGDHAHWLRLLGNGVVPLQAAYAFCSLASSRLKDNHEKIYSRPRP